MHFFSLKRQHLDYNTILTPDSSSLYNKWLNPDLNAIMWSQWELRDLWRKKKWILEALMLWFIFAWMKVMYIACLLYFGWIVVYWIMIIEWWFGPMSYLVTIYFQQFDIINVTRQQIITLTHCFKHYYHLDHYLCKGVSSLTLKEFCRCITTLVCFSQSLVPNLFLFKMKFVFNGNSTPVFAFTKDLIKIWLRSGISE